MKDKNVAGILALLFGVFGVHRFYLGQKWLGVLYILFCLTLIPGIIGFIDAILLLTMNPDEFDRKYNRRYIEGDRQQPDFDRREYTQQGRNGPRYNKRLVLDQPSHRTPNHYRPPARQGKQAKPRKNTFKKSGIEKYRDFDYLGAIQDFEKSLEISPNDAAVHFNLGCAYSLTENAAKAFYHIGQAVSFGFDDFGRIKQHDALAYLRIQPAFEGFVENGYCLAVDMPEEEPSATNPNLLEQLQKLAELRERGVLTETEFIAQKKRLLK